MTLRAAVLEFLVIGSLAPAAGHDRREAFSAAVASALAWAVRSEAGDEGDRTPKRAMLATGRTMEYHELGSESGAPCVLVHGFLGSANMYVASHRLLVKNNIRAVAPNLYGRTTDWARRRSVADAGNDIAALSAHVYGAAARPAIVGCSAGVKDAIASCIALNAKGAAKVPRLFLVSGQVDMARRDVFSLLSGSDQFELNALRGVAKQARLPLLQPVRNAGARIKQNIAHRRVQDMAHTALPAEKLTSKLSAKDLEHLRGDPEFRTVVFRDASSYSYGEIIDSIQRMFGWNLDLSALAGTDVRIMHGTHDTLVHPQNARILEAMLKQAGVPEVRVEFFEAGHLLLKVRAPEILQGAASRAER